MCVAAAAGLAPAAALAQAQQPVFSDQDLAFFETRIRPVLAENCYSCHSHASEQLKAGLHLDHRAGFIDADIAEPGDPQNSLLLEAVRWEVKGTEMPPTHKLSDAQIAGLAQWVEMGLPWPEEPAPEGRAPAEAEDFDLEARRASHWAWHPPQRTEGLPDQVADSVPATIDHLIGARLADAGLSPAPEADRATLIRRLTFDLTGLPPTPAEIDAFVNDASPDAYEKLVDRLLASPRFGETWARHWLDLVRYAETLGHEFDFDLHEPWRYRDYVIQALNEDLPYDQFVREHIAGDLLASPRIDPHTGENQSVIATGFFWLGEQTHSPVDIKAHQADRIDNQIDVLTKTFQGMTVSCARCHDHKFDAIAAADYYALYGMMQSTRWSITELIEREPDSEDAAALLHQRDQIETALKQRWDPTRERVDAYLLTATQIVQAARAIEDPREQNQQADLLAQQQAEETGLDANRLRLWVGYLNSLEIRDPQHPLHAWYVLTQRSPEDAAAWWRDAHRQSTQVTAEAGSLALPADAVALLDINDPSTYTRSGSGFESTPTTTGQLLTAAAQGNAPGQLTAMPGLTTAALTSRHQGALRTHTRSIDRRYVHILAQGNGGRINAVVDGFKLIRDPIYGSLRQVVNTPYPRWYTIDLDKWANGDHELYLEIIESPAFDPASGNSPNHATITVYQVIASSEALPASSLAHSILNELPGPELPDAQALARVYQHHFTAAALSWQIGEELPAAETQVRNALLSTLLATELLELPIKPASGSEPTHSSGNPLAEAIHRFRELDQRQTLAPLALTATEGTGRDAALFKRGNPQLLGPRIARTYLTAIVGDRLQLPAPQGSNRLQLANDIANADNPLTSRVIVNRLWHHLFGQGIVESVDNFGVLGTPPTHPELLDHLAVTFVEDQHWSIKSALRAMVLSDAYRRSSDLIDQAAEAQDPDNLLLHRQNLRRLPAEMIRDNILSTTGRLDETMLGPSVPPYLTAFMNGRGRPQSGPLDGDGRRSIYLGVRRNFLSPMMLAFDAPIPFSTVGQRNTTNVPAQALILMNDPFVHGQARHWAQQQINDGATDPAQRIETMFQHAIGQRPTYEQREALLGYYQRRAEKMTLEADQAMTDARLWQDIAHVMFNLKGFIYVR